MKKGTAVLEERDPRELFREHLESKGTKQKWLADQTGISQEHISNILCSRVLLTDEVRGKINEALGTKF
jgi:plasmid maintenance system antidote protein VapI